MYLTASALIEQTTVCWQSRSNDDERKLQLLGALSFICAADVPLNAPGRWWSFCQGYQRGWSELRSQNLSAAQQQVIWKLPILGDLDAQLMFQRQ